jgi:hypothetical protein
MTSVPGPDDRAKALAILAVGPIEVTPGRPSQTTVHVTNQGDGDASFALAVMGFEPTWAEITPAVGPLSPGETTAVTLTVDLPVGHPAAHLLGTVTARAVDPRSGGVSDAVSSADLIVTVGDSSVLGVSLVPPEVPARRRGRFEVVLQNRSAEALRVDLTAVTTSEQMHVSFEGPTAVLWAGSESRVAGEVSAPRPALGEPVRRPFGVRVQGRTTPVLLEGTMVQRPYVTGTLFRALAILAVLALWAGVAVVGISALDNHLRKQATSRALQNQPPVATAKQPAGTSSGSSGSASGGGGSGGGGSGGSGTGGGAASSSGGTTSTTTTTTPTPRPGGSVVTNDSTAGTGTVTGKVSGAQPAGATVTLTPTSLVSPTSLNPTTQSATLAADVSPDQPLGKIPASLVSDQTPTPTTSCTILKTVSGPDGHYSLPGVPAPCIYQLTISKPGFGTQQYIVQPTAGKAVTQNVTLSAGSGSISGSVLGPGGPLGGASVTITDGTVTVTTRTPTVGDTGSWKVTGLTTPDTYLVEATSQGYSTETTLVTLPAAGSVGGVTLTEKPGLGSITGQVTAASQPDGVGGVTVTATNGSQSRTATTTTVAPVGSYTLPNLTIPGTYAVTVSGPGWVPQTQQVQLTGNAVANANLTPSSANVTGVIGVVGGGGLSDVGVVLSNDSQTFKTLTQSSAPVGAFSFGQVPPGQYVLSAESFGYTTESSEVAVASGQTQTVDLNLPFVGQASEATGTIQGSVVDLFSALPIPGATVYLDNSTTGYNAATSAGYTIPNVTPGIHTVTAKAPHHQDASVTVSVPLGAIAFAPSILLPTLDTIYGTVSSAIGGPVADPTVSLLTPSGNPVPGVTVVVPPCASCVPGVPTAAQGGYEVDDIPQGSYLLEVSGPPTNNAYVTSFVPVTLGLGAPPFLQNVTLNIAPSFTVTTYLTSALSSPAPQQGVTVQLCVQVLPTLCIPLSPVQSDKDGRAVVSPLQIGLTYTATFSYTDSTNQQWTALPVTFVANVNPLPYSAFLTPVFTNEPTVSLNYLFGGVSCPVQTAGSTGSGGCPDIAAGFVPPSVSLQGNFYGTPSQGGGTTQQTVTATGPDVNGTYTFPAGSLNGLTPAAVSYLVAGSSPAFANPPIPAATGLPTKSTSITLTPSAVPISGNVVSADTGLPITKTVSVSVSPGAGVSASVDPVTGDLVWNQSGNTAGLATPGVYSLTFSAAGFDPITLSGPTAVTVPLCWTAPCSVSVGTVGLKPHVAIAVQPQYTAQTGLAGPTVTLKDDTTNKTFPAVGPLAPGGTASFPGLSSSDTYSYTVATPGFATFTCHTPTCSVPTTNPVNTVQPVLSPLGYISGNLEGELNNNPQTDTPLVGVQIEAVDQTSPSSCGSVPLTATTDANGNFSIVGDITQGPGGLCPGDVYKVQLVSAVSGYPFPASTSVTINAVPPVLPQFGTPASLILQAQSVSFAFFLVDDQSPTPSPVTTANVVASSAVAPSVTLTESTGPNGQAEYSSASLFPTAYTFNVTAFGYAPLAIGPITLPPGYQQGTNINTYTLSANRTIKGTAVTPTSGTPSTVSLGAGVTVTLLDQSGTVVATTTTAADGSFSFSLLATGAAIPSGTYQLGAALAGYKSSTSASFKTKSIITTQDVTLTTNEVPLMVTVTSTVASDTLSGATVTLTRATPPSATPTVCTATSPSDTPQQSTIFGFGQGPSTSYTTGVGNSLQVVPDYYMLNVDPGTGHPPQTAIPIYVCPDASGTGNDTYTSPAPAFEVQEGLVTGTVSAATSVATATVKVTATKAGSVTNPAITCTGTCLSGTYSEYVPLGDSYAVHITLAGYSPANSPSPPPVLTAASPTDTFDATLVALTHTVTVQLSSGGPSPFDLAGATVKLASAGVTYPASGTTARDGTASFDNVPPGTYDLDVAWTDPTTTTTTFTTAETNAVQFGPMAGDPPTFPISVAVASLTGSATLTNPLPPASGTAVTYTVCAWNGTACTGTVYTDSSLNDTDTTSGVVATPTIMLAPGTYQLTASASGYTKVTPVVVTLAAGDRTTAATIAVTN